MRYDIKDSGKRKIEAIVVSHKGKEIEFRGVQCVNGGDADQELFEFMNEYFEGCKDAQLDRLWEIFVSAKRILHPGYFDEEESLELVQLRAHGLDYKFLTKELGPMIKEMYDLFPPSEIAYAAQVTGRTISPKDLMTMASMGDYPEETTINKEKYSELVKLTFAAQLCFPVINQLLDQIVTVTGKDYQYAVVGEMISKITSFTSTAGWYVLDTYIRASCTRQESRRNTTDVVSDYRYVDFIVYKGLFSKLALSFIPSKNRDKNLSKELNSLVEGEIRKEQSTKFTTFAEKKPGSDDQSIPESYRIAQSVNGTDELAMAEYFAFGMFDEEDAPRTRDIFRHQCLGLGIKDRDTAEKLYYALPTVWNFRFTNLHYQLLQLVFIKDINYYLYPAMNYRQLMAAIVLGQVKLYEMGYEHLAVLLGMVRDPNGAVAYMSDEFKLTAKERDRLVEHCYLYIGQCTSSTDNMLVKSTQDFLDELAASGWNSNIEPGLLGKKKFVDKLGSGDMFPVDIVMQMKHELISLITGEVKQSDTIEKE